MIFSACTGDVDCFEMQYCNVDGFCKGSLNISVMQSMSSFHNGTVKSVSITFIFTFSSGKEKYNRTKIGSPCDQEQQEIESEEECKRAAATLDLQWGEAWNVPNGFPGCFYAQDWRNKTFFNRDPTPGRTNTYQKFSAICKISEGT